MIGPPRFTTAYPAIADLRDKARRRIPFFAFEYLDSGTGRDEACARNEMALSTRCLVPRFFRGACEPSIETELFGRRYAAPIGVAPVGMTSLMWPGAEQMLARMAADKGIPYCLSTVAAEPPEMIGPLAKGNGWFQLYPARRIDMRDDLIARAAQSGFSALVLTVDVPAPSIRERQKRADLTMPPEKTLLFWWRVVTRPAWAIATLKRGEPRFLTLEKYASTEEMQSHSQYFGRELCGTLDWDYVRAVRRLWKGPLLLKGILSAADAALGVEHGADGIWVSNHGGRQLDGAPAAIDCLRAVKDAVGDKAKVVFDSGVRSGLDVGRVLHEGADFAFAGRPFIYGVSALGEAGATHATELLIADLKNAMIQLGCRDLTELQTLDAS
jgi:L-lactate dehydrogenase (cytochrome)